MQINISDDETLDSFLQSLRRGTFATIALDAARESRANAATINVPPFPEEMLPAVTALLGHISHQADQIKALEATTQMLGAALHYMRNTPAGDGS